MKRFITASFLFGALLLAGCSSDEPSAPSNAISLNMMNEQNGGTRLGNTDVYINYANNFISDNYAISDLGHKGGFNSDPDMSQVSYEVAVTPGNFYQIFADNNVVEIAGRRAYPVEASYYNVYVESWIRDKDNNPVGAKVAYAECEPVAKELPEWDSQIEIDLKSKDGMYPGEYEYVFNKGIEIDPVHEILDNDYRGKLEVKSTDNRIVFRALDWSPIDSEVIVYIRSKSVFSRVRFHVTTD